VNGAVLFLLGLVGQGKPRAPEVTGDHTLMTLLHLDSSAHRASKSVSRQLTALFARRWRSRYGDANYRYRDLAARPVPGTGEAYCDLGRRVERRGLGLAGPVDGLIQTAAEQHEWDLTRPLVDELLGSEVLLVGAPMYNYSVPAALKAWIDRISFPGVFASPADGSSLIVDLRVIVVTACGGSYGPGTGTEKRDFLTPYLRAYFAKQGVPMRNIEVVTADMTLAEIVPGRENLCPLAEDSLHRARDRLANLAESF
jgi:FMN-dependent NADH-azoreductase